MNVDFTCEELYAIERTLTKHGATDSDRSALTKIRNIKISIGSIFNIKGKSGEYEVMFCQTNCGKAQFICLNDGNRIFDIEVPLTTTGVATLKEIFDTHEDKIIGMKYLGKYGDTSN